jgi:hypothetical protein
MDKNFGCRYDGILGQDFWKSKEATIDYCNRKITMGNVVIDETTDFPQLLTVKSRTAFIVRLPTKTRGTGIISKGELATGVYLAETLTEGIGGYCITSVVNTKYYTSSLLPSRLEFHSLASNGSIH